jgi:hypothetical protein
MNRFRLDKVAARLGIGVGLLGFVVMFIGWNGAASTNSVAGQVPYLISGGLVGLGLVVIGAALILVETSREDREHLRHEIASLREALEGTAVASTNGRKAAPPPKPAEEPASGRGQYLAGDRSFHRPGCRLLEGREAQVERVTLELAAKRRLAPCRVCEPARSRQP